jgi:hypothetical protein
MLTLVHPCPDYFAGKRGTTPLATILWAVVTFLKMSVPQGALSSVPTSICSALIVWRKTLPLSSRQKSALERVHLAFSKLNCKTTFLYFTRIQSMISDKNKQTQYSCGKGIPNHKLSYACISNGHTSHMYATIRERSPTDQPPPCFSG